MLDHWKMSEGLILKPPPMLIVSVVRQKDFPPSENIQRAGGGSGDGQG